MVLREIDQIKEAERNAVNLIEKARNNHKSALVQAEQAGKDLTLNRISDADKTLRTEMDTARELISQETEDLMKKAEEEAARLTEQGKVHMQDAILKVAGLIIGEDLCFTRPE